MTDKPTVHLIVTDEGDFGVSVRSPQIDGFELGRPTLKEAQKDVVRVLRDLGVTGQVAIHEERRYVSPEGSEFTIRFRADAEDRPLRLETAWRLEAMMGTEQRLQVFQDAEPNPMGEIAFICLLPKDPVAEVVAQMDERDAVVLAVSVADQGIWTMTFMSSPDATDWPTLAEQGITDDSTVQDLMRQADSVPVPRRALVRI